MKINGIHQKSVWLKPGTEDVIQIIDQRTLPHKLIFEDLDSCEVTAVAIEEMHLRGAPLIGIVAAFGVYYAYKEAATTEELSLKIKRLRETRPTAINLNWAIDKQLELIENDGELGRKDLLKTLFANAFSILEEDVDLCFKIGEHTLPLIEEISRKKKG